MTGMGFVILAEGGKVRPLRIEKAYSVLFQARIIFSITFFIQSAFAIV